MTCIFALYYIVCKFGFYAISGDLYMNHLFQNKAKFMNFDTNNDT